MGENENQTILQKKLRSVRLPKGKRIILFFLIVSVEFSVNISSGLISSASKNIKSRFKMTDQQFGMFGTANGIGRVIGSSMFAVLVNLVSRKWSFVIFLILKSLTLISFKVFEQGWLLIIMRGFIGFFHMPVSIYIPVWIDQYGIRKYKTIFMTILLTTVPSGKVTGYILHYLLGEDNWQTGFAIEGSYLLFLSFIFSLTSDDYFSSKLFYIKDKNVDDDDIESGSCTIFRERKSANKPQSSNSFAKDIGTLLTTPIFIFSMATRAFLMGCSTALNYWISDYMRTVLMIDDNRKILYSYCIMATGGPLIGIFISNLVRLIVPSYEHKYAPHTLMILHAIASIFGIAIGCMSHLIPFCCVTTMFYAFSSVTLPYVQGSIATSVPPKLKGSAFAVANLFHQLFTSGPSPMVYGIINDHYKHKYKSLAMFSITGLYFSAFFLIIVLVILRVKASKNNERDSEAFSQERYIQMEEKK